ncbi:hypothetical protein MA16_Dca009885 [Dendrobium catenatum]|uniref:Uncharacterized protein n=1 Tax=Dendrobium catenatum TaxID=906689 RepID=A0A2I0VKH2_9ASPA|nr:hypothetical protein MA16_Dca009885 [Dendrobium catenatum]
MKLEDHKESRGEYLTWKDMRRELNLKYRPSTSDCHLEHHPTSFVGTTRGPYCDQDHPPISNIRVAAPPFRSSLNLNGRPSTGSSIRQISYDSPRGLTSGQLSQSLASPVFDPISVILIKDCSKKKKSTEPEYIHFVDTIDNDDFFEGETDVIDLNPLPDLNPDLGDLEPLNLDTLAHPYPSLLEDNSLDKVCLVDSNMISKEANLAGNTINLNSEDPDLVVSPTESTLDLCVTSKVRAKAIPASRRKRPRLVVYFYLIVFFSKSHFPPPPHAKPYPRSHHPPCYPLASSTTTQAPSRNPKTRWQAPLPPLAAGHHIAPGHDEDVNHHNGSLIVA